MQEDYKESTNDDTLDDLVINGLKIFQPRRGYRFSLDAVLLAHYPELERVRSIIDLGTGSGVIPLLLSQRCDAAITGVEIQPVMAARALRSVQYNCLEKRIKIIEADVNCIQQYLPPACADLVVSNPPFWKIGEGKLSLNREEAIARHELKLNLAQLINRAAYLLPAGGRMALIHHPGRLQETMELLTANGFKAGRLRTVHPNRKTEARMILLEAVKNSHRGLKILPPLYIYQEDGSYSQEILQIYSGREEGS